MGQLDGRNLNSLAGSQICIPYDQTGVITALKGSSLVLRYNLDYILYDIDSKIIRKLDNSQVMIFDFDYISLDIFDELRGIIPSQDYN